MDIANSVRKIKRNDRLICLFIPLFLINFILIFIAYKRLVLAQLNFKYACCVTLNIRIIIYDYVFVNQAIKNIKLTISQKQTYNLIAFHSISRKSGGAFIALNFFAFFFLISSVIARMIKAITKTAPTQIHGIAPISIFWLL